MWGFSVTRHDREREFVSAARPQDRLLHHYEQRLGEFGDSATGACWPNEHDRQTRYGVMLDLIDAAPHEKLVLCDLGCGTGGLLAEIRRRGLQNVEYIGIDRSPGALAYARAKFPDAAFLELDVTAPDPDLRSINCDYLVANGLFTGKFDLTHEEMWAFLVTVIDLVWPHVRRGLAFNVMSKVVDWERDDLFHLPMDEAAQLLHRLAGRRVRMRADYGLYEYTAYAYKNEDCRVPVLRPRLPDADMLLPYLRRIDAARIYTNHGPLSSLFEKRLAEHWALPPDGVVCASSGTAALIGAIIGSAGRARKERPIAMVPAFTFVATAAAVQACGYDPYVVDVDADSWMIDPERLSHHPLLTETGLLVVVSPFGRAVAQEPWTKFQKSTGIPVVIDGAASFDQIELCPSRFAGAIPVVLSFHATKGFSTGEGGAVTAGDVELAARAAQALNFGFHGTRNSETASINGKMSEYHAAVGLAELDGWARKREELEAVTARYRLHMGKVGLSDRFIATPMVSLAYALYRCRDADDARRTGAQLDRAGIRTRLWYELGIHRHSWFSELPRDNLEVTDSLAPGLMGLPMAPDLTDEQIARIATICAEAANAAESVR